MKYFKLLVLLIAPMIILSSCSKSTGVQPPVVPTPGITFKVNGSPVKTDTQGALFYDSEKELNVGGVYNNKNSGVTLIISNAHVGTFDVVNDHLTVMLADNWVNYVATTGTVTITALSGTSASGTFQFTGALTTGETLTVTEGEFTADIVHQM